MNNLIRIISLFVLLLAGINSNAQYAVKQADSLLNDLKNNPVVNRDEAILLCDSLIAFYKASEEKCKQIKVLLRRSQFEKTSSQFEKAVATLLEAQKVYDQSSCDEELQVSIYLVYSNLFCTLDQQDKADSIALIGIRMFKPTYSDKATLVKLYMAAADGMYKPIEESLPYLDTALQMAKEYDLLKLEQNVLVSIAANYGNHENYDEAKKYMQLALQVAIERNSTLILGSIYNNLAGLSDDEDEVLLYIDSALYYAELNNNLQDIQLYTENKAYFYSTIGDFEEGYYELWESMVLKDSLLNIKRIEAIAEMEQKYEAEKKTNEIQSLKVENLKTEVENLNYKRNQNRLLVGSISLLVLAVIFAYNFLNTRKNRNKLAKKNTEIEKARQLSDELLLNILPSEIALELKEKGQAEARKFDSVSILFTDFKEFTETSQKLSATELVSKINYCFKGFDDIMGKYGIEKIKTIGDAYMSAGGLSVTAKDSVKNTVLAGLEMQEFIAIRKKELDLTGEIAFEMRVGIHTGPVVAGIVGVKKFQYDLWGDTVNTASRMETNGTEGKVNISGATYELIKDDTDFTFENRGKIKVKGKGEIDMYFVSLVKES